MNPLHILTVGAAVRDVFLTSPDFTVIRSPKFSGGYGECVSLGAKVEVQSCIFSTGGGATNAAATFARLGFSTGVVANLGNDEQGEAILADLHAFGVSDRYVKKNKKEQTGYSTLLTTQEGERTVLVFRGASAVWKASDIPTLPNELKALYLTSLGGNLDVAEIILTRAKKRGIFVVWNPGSAELRQGSRVTELLPLVSLLLVNKDEAQLLTAKQNADVPLLAATLHRLVPRVAITDGSRGSYFHDATSLWFARASAINSLSRTGAGDAFGSALAASLLHELDSVSALQVATLNAESVIQHVGAKAGILHTWPSPALRAKVRVTPTQHQ